MIQSAMIFALGAFASGLVWLAFSVALVRRTRRLTERQLLASMATRRAEFASERDELRARHAVQMHRLEREVSRVLDMATAHRLEADLKERDLINLRAELAARDDAVEETQHRLAGERDLIQDLERRHAGDGTALRAAQHQLNLEQRRRAMAQAALDEAHALSDKRRLALIAMREANDALRVRLGEPPGTPTPLELEDTRLPKAAMPELPPVAAETEVARSASVVVLPTRARQLAAESPERSAIVVAEATRDLQRLAGEEPGESVNGVRRDPAEPAPRMPAATLPGETNVGELVALRMASKPSGSVPIEEPDIEENAETRFFEALAEIRALKRSANQAGE